MIGIYYFAAGVFFLLLYWGLPERYRSGWIMAGNVLFLLSFGPAFYFLHLFSALLNFGAAARLAPPRSGTAAGRLVLGRRPLIILTILANVMILIFARLILAPFQHEVFTFGVSFYTLTNLGYFLTVVKFPQKREEKFSRFYLFSGFFPTVLMGPIERASNLLPQITGSQPVVAPEFLAGTQLIALGFFKKFVIADRLSILTIKHQEFFAGYSTLELWLVFFLGFVQIYCDFSAYIDIVRGFAQLLGISLSENFRRPYLAQSIPDIWNRWNITVVNWLREFVYLPVMMKTKSIELAIASTMLAMAFWHSPTLIHVYWGLYWTLLYWGHVQIRRRGGIVSNNRPFNAGLMLLAMSFSTVFFLAHDSRELVSIILRSLTPQLRFSIAAFVQQYGGLGLTELAAAVVLVVGLETSWIRRCGSWVSLAITGALVFLTALMSVSESTAFIYMRY